MIRSMYSSSCPIRTSIFPGVFTLNIDSGVTRTVVGSHPPVLDWIADRDGVVRFGYGFRDDSALYLARNSAKDQWRTLEKFKRFEDARFEPLGFGPLPNQLFVLAPQQDRDAIWQMDLARTATTSCCLRVPTWTWTAWSPGPISTSSAFSTTTDQPHTEFIDPEAAAIDRAMDQAVPGTFHHVVDTARDGHLLLIRSFSDVEPGIYHLLDMSKHELTAIGRVNSALSRATLAPTKPVVVPGPGGISMHGYLTLPVGTTPGQAHRRCGIPTWRPLCARRVGLRRSGAAHGQSRLRRAAAELPRARRATAASGAGPGIRPGARSCTRTSPPALAGS